MNRAGIRLPAVIAGIAVAVIVTVVMTASSRHQPVAGIRLSYHSGVNAQGIAITYDAAGICCANNCPGRSRWTSRPNARLAERNAVQALVSYELMAKKWAPKGAQ